MFCSSCGTELQIDGVFCHKCGRQVSTADSLIIESSEVGQVKPDAKNREDLIAKIRQGAPDLYHCQICSASAELSYIEFGLGKLKMGRRWDETVASILFSAVSLPATGIGRVVFPSKKSDIGIVCLRLVLCSSCLTAQPDFTVHPWFQKLWQAGFNQFIPPDKLGLPLK